MYPFGPALVVSQSLATLALANIAAHQFAMGSFLIAIVGDRPPIRSGSLGIGAFSELQPAQGEQGIPVKVLQGFSSFKIPVTRFHIVEKVALVELDGFFEIHLCLCRGCHRHSLRLSEVGLKALYVKPVGE